jgi:septum formation protein
MSYRSDDAAARLLLGSGSPRRREILTSLRVPFVVHVAPADESTRAGEGPGPYLDRVVLAKLAAVTESADLTSSSAVLVADTSVIDDGAILGKPADVDEAEAMIARLAGRTHEVWTRFVLGAPSRGGAVLHAETVVTRVTFRPLTPAQIRAYAESGEGTDKAGAYAVQGLGAGIVSRIEGSYTNVVGLPACEVLVALEGLGLAP